MWLIVQAGVSLTDPASPLCFEAQGSWCAAQGYGPHPWFCDTSTLKRCVTGLLQRERKVDSLMPTSHILLVCLRPGDKRKIRWEPSIWSPLLTYIYRMAHIALICEEGWLYLSTPPPCSLLSPGNGSLISITSPANLKGHDSALI